MLKTRKIWCKNIHLLRKHRCFHFAESPCAFRCCPCLQRIYMQSLICVVCTALVMMKVMIVFILLWRSYKSTQKISTS